MTIKAPLVMKVGGKTLPYNKDAVAYYKRAGVNVRVTYGRKTPTGGYIQGPQRGWSGKTMIVHGKRLPYNADAAAHYKKAGVNVKTDNRGGRVQVPWKGTITRPKRLPKYVPVTKGGAAPTKQLAKAGRLSGNRRPRTVKVQTNPGRRHSGTVTKRLPPWGSGRNIRLPNRA